MIDPTRNNATAGGLAAWGKKVFDYAQKLAARILVHFLAIVCAGVFVQPLVAPDAFLAGLGVYIGLICIVARGMGKNPGWVVPAATGVLQALVLAFSGFPAHQAVFWGGAQSWLQRLLGKRFAIGGEWAVLFFLAPLAVHFGGAVYDFFFLAISFLCVAALGRGFFLLYTRRDARKSGQSVSVCPAEPNAVAAHKASLGELRGKEQSLPYAMRPTLLALAESGDKILQCMTEDPRDVAPGDKFLKRYLAATHSVVDNHVRLSRERVITMDVVKALTQSEDMLKRLEAAFAEEHQRLLQNDVADFSADLAVLDTLLKMDGR